MLEVRIKKLGTLAIFSLQGRIVIGETAVLRDAVESLRQVTVLLLDMGGVTMVDASGLGAMLELRQELKAKGIALRLTNATDRVSRIFEITRLSTVFEITSQSAESLDQAIQVDDLLACA
jgi:Anti-anti-sigma regulatory factor (antagonist of anti-sigma factor)